MYARTQSISCCNEALERKITLVKSRRCSNGYSNTCVIPKTRSEWKCSIRPDACWNSARGTAMTCRSFWERCWSQSAIRCGWRSADPTRSSKTFSPTFTWKYFIKVAGSRWMPPCHTRWAGHQEQWLKRSSRSKGGRT
jgi:hypothetical protein